MLGVRLPWAKLKHMTQVNEKKLSVSMVRGAARQIAEIVEYFYPIGICHVDKPFSKSFGRSLIANVSVDLTSSNVLFEMKSIDAWTEEEVYKNFGKHRTERLGLEYRGETTGEVVRLVESIQYPNIEEKCLTGRIRIIDFGEWFFKDIPPSVETGYPDRTLPPRCSLGGRPLRLPTSGR